MRLERGGAEVDTVEHLLAVCSGLQVDNLRVEMSGREMPGLDGSGKTLVELFRQAGMTEQRAKAPVFRVEQPIYVRDEMATLVALPAEKAGLTLQYIASFSDPEVEGGSFQVELTPETFENEIAPARTFCLASEVDQLRAAGARQGRDAGEHGRAGGPADRAAHAGRARPAQAAGPPGRPAAPGRGTCTRTSSRRARDTGPTHSSCAGSRTRLEAKETGGLIRRDTGLDVREVMRMLPHRYPFLLIDRVIEIDGYQRAVAIKNVSINEPFFEGHFPDKPLMPGVLQLEAMAQLSGVLLLRKLEHTGKLAVLWSIDKVKLRAPVEPGDQLRIEVETTRMKGELAQVKGRGTVAGRTVCEAVLTFTMVEP